MTRVGVKKVRAFRLGLVRVSRSGTVQFKPVASVGLAADGGVFITPAPKGGSWTYGVLRTAVPADSEHVTTEQTPKTPKLHYHRSGIVSVTLTGQDLEYRCLRLPPLKSVKGAQILSVHRSRTWDLPTRGEDVPAGDFITPVKRWPDCAAWGIWLLTARAKERDRLVEPGFGRGLLPGGPDFTHGVVSLEAYGRQAVLVITVTMEDDVDFLPPSGGTTVTALRWRQSGPKPTDEAFALWSAELRNPVIHADEHVPPSFKPEGSISERPISDLR